MLTEYTTFIEMSYIISPGWDLSLWINILEHLFTHNGRIFCLHMYILFLFALHSQLILSTGTARVKPGVAV